jgi:uncharacterized protein YegL
MPDQIPFAPNDFAINPEPRVASILVLDVSGSMLGTPVSQLNEGIRAYKNELAGDSLASKRVEVCIITFGGQVAVLNDFTTADNFIPPELQAEGDTPMGRAISMAVEKVAERKAEYRSNGVMYYRPWIFLITDGAPTDEWRSAAQRVREGESKKEFSFWAIGVEGADMGILRQISVREPLMLRGMQFKELFKWLSNSQQSVSRSTPGDAVPLQNPATPSGWAEV